MKKTIAIFPALALALCAGCVAGVGPMRARPVGPDISHVRQVAPPAPYLPAEPPPIVPPAGEDAARRAALIEGTARMPAGEVPGGRPEPLELRPLSPPPPRAALPREAAPEPPAKPVLRIKSLPDESPSR